MTDRLPELVIGAVGCLSDQGLELGEYHLDGVEIGAVWWQEKNHAPMSFRIAAAFGLRWVASLS